MGEPAGSILISISHVRRFITFLKEAKFASVMLYKLVLRNDPGQGQADNPAAGVWVSLGMVSECPKWLDLKQIPGAAWGEAQSSSSIYVYITLGPSTALLWDPPCPWWTSQPYSVMSPLPWLSFCTEPASRLWNHPCCVLRRDYQGIRDLAWC